MRFILFLAASFLTWVSGFFIFVWDAETLSQKQVYQRNATQKSDAIIVLTGARNRIKKGLELLENQTAPCLLISGVLTHISKPSLIRISGFKGSVPLKKVILDYKSTTTEENAKYSTLWVDKWIEKKPLTQIHLVTSSYHMRRSLVEFQNKLPEIKFIPQAISPLNTTEKPWDSSQKNLILYLTEYTKYLVAYIKNIVPSRV